MYIIEKVESSLRDFTKLDADNIDDAMKKAKEIYENEYCEAVNIRETTEDFFNEYLEAAKTMDDFDFYDWFQDNEDKMDIEFTVDSEYVADKIYFCGVEAQKNIDYAIWDYERNYVEKIEDGCSILIGKDVFGEYWFAVSEEEDDIYEKYGTFHNVHGRDLKNWKEWYKKEWIIEVTKQEIDRLHNYANRGYEWVTKK